jgi:hypothetical protein
MHAKPETVIAAYRPKPGKESELRRLVKQHRTALAAAHLITARPTLLLRAPSDGTLLEIFEWLSAKAADEAHQHPSIRKMWSRFARVADFVPLSDIKEAGKAFSHFEALGAANHGSRGAARKPPKLRRTTR